MALGSKGSGGGGSKRGRPYGMMLLLAFGAAVLGVMVLHKLRERHIFTLLIKDKDHDLLALQLLLQVSPFSLSLNTHIHQRAHTRLNTLNIKLNSKDKAHRLILVKSSSVMTKERESAKEMKRKVEELKAKTYSLRTQKMELINKKETEIGQLKHQIEKPTNIWSVSTDDPSNPAVNLTSEAVSDKTGNWKHTELEASFKDEQLEKSYVHDDGKPSSVKGEGDIKVVTEGTELKETHGEQKHKFENGRDGEASRERINAVEKNTEENHRREKDLGDSMSSLFENPQGKEGFIERGENEKINKTEVTAMTVNGGLNSENGGSDAMTTNGKMEMKLKRQDKSGSKVRDDSERTITRAINRRRIISREMATSENGVAKRMGGNIITVIPHQKRRKVIRRDGRLHQNDNTFAVDKVSVEGNTFDHYNVKGLRRADRVDFREKRGVDSSEVNSEQYKTYESEEKQSEDSKQGVIFGDSSFIQTAKDTRAISANSTQQVGNSDDLLSKDGQLENKQASQYEEDQKISQVTNADSSTNSMEQKEVKVVKQEEDINAGERSESSEVKHVKQQPEETEVHQ
ncbi:hypothetical protein IFM89_032034 [Coptis chinensis]|uniref:Micronuclear linker histone polyprotein-like protein n=1 Tax=Coptis chinensis TaxID=261450 RepID=A0A835H0E5_9MAGN|nr:hypothetical protein IFM89_032034 [Coptis chinensis]